MQILLRLLIVCAVALPSARGVETRYWQQGERSDFEKAKLHKLSLRSDGMLSLAPVFTEVLDSSSAYLWALASDSRGNVYAGGGEPGGSRAKLYVIPPGGNGRILAELDGMEIHALAVDAKDRVYAATSPDGKVYRVPAGGAAEVFYSPGVKYIWAMTFDKAGNLFIATGERGEIHRVSPDGKGEVFYRTEETHARSLAVDARGNLIVGTEPGGLIVRISPAGAGFVLYQGAKREVTAVAVAPDGSIYAAAVGNKQPAAPVVPAQIPLAPAPVPGTTPTAPGQAAQPAPAAPPPSFTPPAISGGSDVYRILPDGSPRKVWSHPADIVYAIAFDANSRPLLGSGNKGAIYRLDSELLHTSLLTAAPTQVTTFCGGPGGGLYAATGNTGKVFRIGPGLEKEGWIESDVFDAGLFSLWGALHPHASLSGGRIAFEARSGNLDRPRKDWSPWVPVKMAGEYGRVESPPARFLQWKAAFTQSPGGQTPALTLVEVAYLPKNTAPAVELIEITPANYRFPAPSLSLTPTQNLTLPPLSRTPRPSVASSSLEPGSANSMQYAKGFLGARWLASDENGDGLKFKVEIRGEGETEWKLLKDDVKERYLSWDSTAYPDGEYMLRVTADDGPDNPPEHTLRAELVSSPFTIDNTAPRILGLAAARSQAGLTVRWKAVDAGSVIDKAEYSLDGGPWTVVEPVTRLSDSPELEYNLAIKNVGPGEHTVAVRVADYLENQAVEKSVVR